MNMQSQVRGPLRIPYGGYTRHISPEGFAMMPEPKPEDICECNGGAPCACPDCDHIDCGFRDNPDIDYMKGMTEDEYVDWQQSWVDSIRSSTEKYGK